MPIYEYKCLTCGIEFELLRKIADMDSVAVCPSGHKSIQRIFTTVFSHSHNKENEDGKSVEKIPNLILDNVHFENCGTGIKVNKSYIKGRRVKMESCDTGIDATDSDVEIEDLDIS